MPCWNYQFYMLHGVQVSGNSGLGQSCLVLYVPYTYAIIKMVNILVGRKIILRIFQPFKNIHPGLIG